MATQWNPTIIPHRTDANMAGKAWFIVKVNGTNDMDLCGAGEMPLGVLTDDLGAAAVGEKFLDVQVAGPVCKVVAGGTVTAGAAIASDASGEAVDAADGDWAIGYAIEGGADGETIAYIPGVFYLETT